MQSVDCLPGCTFDEAKRHVEAAVVLCVGQCAADKDELHVSVGAHQRRRQLAATERTNLSLDIVQRHIGRHNVHFFAATSPSNRQRSFIHDENLHSPSSVDIEYKF